MNKYIKKPIEIEAIKWNGQNFGEIAVFCKDILLADTNKDELLIKTLEGNMIASLGDYIIKGVKGEFYPCKPDIFEKTYTNKNSANIVLVELSKNELSHLINDTISYIYHIKENVFGDNWNLGTDISEVEVLTEEQKESLTMYGYYSRKKLYDKLRKIEKDNFPELNTQG